jgi:hypothetical protein
MIVIVPPLVEHEHTCVWRRYCQEHWGQLYRLTNRLRKARREKRLGEMSNVKARAIGVVMEFILRDCEIGRSFEGRWYVFDLHELQLKALDAIADLLRERSQG